ncbi:MAG TPA: hypothetical protein VI796_00400, partial [Candidatus Thermoplasmatota archaeon]|nr:hypothetical protein [Candidatus Thermoplasmatota archaeon]
MRLLLACFLLAAAPVAAAGAMAEAPMTLAAEAACTAAATASPCGWVNPLIRLDFPQKPPCGAGLPPATPLDRSTCLALPAVGEPVGFDGTLSWYWDVSNEGFYPNDPANDIVISFGGTASNPAWMALTVEPATLTLTTADFIDPANYRTVGDDPLATRLFFWYERPLHVTLERTGPPGPGDAESVAARDGTVAFFLKARSTESSERIKAGFGVEEFRFDASADPDLGASKEAPAPALPVALASLAAAALIRRRR